MLREWQHTTHYGRRTRRYLCDRFQRYNSHPFICTGRYIPSAGAATMITGELLKRLRRALTPANSLLCLPCRLFVVRRRHPALDARVIVRKEFPCPGVDQQPVLLLGGIAISSSLRLRKLNRVPESHRVGNIIGPWVLGQLSIVRLVGLYGASRRRRRKITTRWHAPRGTRQIW